MNEHEPKLKYRFWCKSGVVAPVFHQLWRAGSRQRKVPPIFVSGSPRSGTTWVLETLEQLLFARRHWEPVKGFQREIGTDVGANGGLRPYIDKAGDLPELEERLAATLCNDRPPAEVGRMLTSANSRVQVLKRIIRPDLTILKFTAAQRLLPWITRSFANNGAMLIRNPLAVVASGKSMSPRRGGWGKEASRSYSPSIIKRIFPQLEDLEGDNLTNIRALAIQTCVDLMLPIHDRGCQQNLIMVPYEALTRDYDLFFEVVRSMGLEEFLIGKSIRNKPSKTTKEDSNVLKGKDPNQSWQHRLDRYEIEEVCYVMDRFGIDFYGDQSGFDCGALKQYKIKTIVC